MSGSYDSTQVFKIVEVEGLRINRQFLARRAAGIEDPPPFRFLRAWSGDSRGFIGASFHHRSNPNREKFFVRSQLVKRCAKHSFRAGANRILTDLDSQAAGGPHLPGICRSKAPW